MDEWIDDGWMDDGRADRKMRNLNLLSTYYMPETMLCAEETVV